MIKLLIVTAYSLTVHVNITALFLKVHLNYTKESRSVQRLPAPHHFQPVRAHNDFLLTSRRPEFSGRIVRFALKPTKVNGGGSAQLHLKLLNVFFLAKNTPDSTIS